jgi:hypothetical protein
MFDALETDKLASLRRDLAVPVFDIGPLHVHSPAASRSLLQQDRGCVDWLDAALRPCFTSASAASPACPPRH